jgi:hypothetical protein
MKPGWLILMLLFAGMPAASAWAQEQAPPYRILSYSQQAESADDTGIRSNAVNESGYVDTVGESPQFLLEFADVRDGTGHGFDDPEQGSTRRAITRSVFERMSEVLAGEPGSARILIDSSSPWLNQDTLAVGIPLFQCVDGFQKPIIHKALREDIHVHSHEGELLVNFDLPISASDQRPPAGQYDLYTLIFHEMIHILGFVGFTVEPDGRPRDCGGARMLPAIAQFTTDASGNPLWKENSGDIEFVGQASSLPSNHEPIFLDLPEAQAEVLRLATSSLRVSGHWLPEDFAQRRGVLMLREPFPTGEMRRNMTPETKGILSQVLGYQVAQEARGLSGAWVDSQLNGQGFTLHFIGKSRFVIYFYGFTDSGERLWMLGVHDGAFKLGETLQLNLVEAAGGRFNHFDQADIYETPWGSLEIRFQDCLNAEATLSGIDGIQSMQLFPLARIDGLDCY